MRCADDIENGLTNVGIKKNINKDGGNKLPFIVFYYLFIAYSGTFNKTAGTESIGCQLHAV